MSNCLAIDLGTSTGYAYNIGEQFFCGTWTLATAAEIRAWGISGLRRARDPRPQRLCQKVLDLGFIPDIVVFEDVEFASRTQGGLYQVQLWSALRTSLWMCIGDATRFECVSVQTLKSFAIAGNASKDDMNAALKKFHPKLWTPGLTHDTVDAIWIFLWAKAQLKLP